MAVETLSAVTTVSSDSSYVIVYRSTTDENVRVSLTDVVDNTIGLAAWASANAVGAANETFTGFFATAPINIDEVVVYFNGLALKRGGWTISGTNLTLVDSVNGYSTEAGDVITSYYRSWY